MTHDDGKVVRARSFARAGFLGNPSDGYFGKTISFPSLSSASTCA